MVGEVSYQIGVVIHVLFAVIAVGAVIVVDYLHLVGFRKKKLEKKIVKIYPYLSQLINYALIGIIASGAFLAYNNQALLSSPIFRMKMSLVLLVMFNGLYLQKKVGPVLDKCVIKGTRYCSNNILISSVVFGSISVTTWLAILILSLTKTMGYAYWQFLVGYLVALVIVMSVAYLFERKARKWHA